MSNNIKIRIDIPPQACSFICLVVSSFQEKFPGLVPSTPEVSIFRFCPETHGQNPVIVLGSDGLWDYVKSVIPHHTYH